MKYFQSVLVSAFLSISLIQCSNNSQPGQPSQPGQKESDEYIEPVRVLDEIPPHIREVENLTIFPGDAEPGHSVELILEREYGKAGEPFLSVILGVVVDERNRVIVTNSLPVGSTGFPFLYNLYAFNNDGSFHSQIGRKGRGPGEYGAIIGTYAKTGKIVVYDFTGLRLLEYSTTDYTLSRSLLFEQWKAKEGFEFEYVEPRNDGNYMVRYSEPGSKTAWLEHIIQVTDKTGSNIDSKDLIFWGGFKIKVGQTLRPSMPLTFMGRTVHDLSDEDILYTAFTRDFLIRKYDPKGQYQSAFYYPIEGTEFDLDEYVGSAVFSPNKRIIGQAFEEMEVELPETFPVVANLMVDDENRIWVAVPTGKDRENYEWWILQESGELLAKLVLPREQPIYDIKKGFVYSKAVNEDTGSEYVVKYRIDLTTR